MLSIDDIAACPQTGTLIHNTTTPLCWASRCPGSMQCMKRASSHNSIGLCDEHHEEMRTGEHEV
jgi:hypothetical protein